MKAPLRSRWFLTLILLAVSVPAHLCGQAADDTDPSYVKFKELYQGGKYADAIPYAREFLSGREKALGPGSLVVASALNNLAELYRLTGALSKAEPLHLRALRIKENALGPDDPSIAVTLSNLASLYVDQGEYARAEPLYERALGIREKALGPDHPRVGAILTSLASLKEAMGEYAGAEPMLRRALAIDEKAKGTDDPDVATDLTDLALLFLSMSDYEKAEPLFERALAIDEQALGPDRPEVATNLSNLAELYRRKGEYARAEPLLERAVTIDEKSLGPRHPDLATDLNNLGALRRAMGSDVEAESLYRRALAIREEALGPTHPRVAETLNNLAFIFHARGDNAAAGPLLRRALAIDEKALGPDHPEVATVLDNLAFFEAIAGLPLAALGDFQKALAIEDRQIRNIFSVATEQQKLKYARSISGSALGCLSLIAQRLSGDRGAVRYGLTLTLRRKGLVLDAQSQVNDALRARLSEGGKKDWDELSSLRSALSRLLLSGPGALSGGEYADRVSSMERRVEEAERELSAANGLSPRDLGRDEPTVDGVAKGLPARSALIEFTKVRDYDFASGGWAGTERYLAFVLRPAGEVRLVDLGDAQSIDADVGSALGGIRETIASGARESVTGSIRALGVLHARIWAPLEGALAGTDKVLLSPDGALNLVPFAALTDAGGRALVEKYVIGYIGSGRELGGPKRSAGSAGVGLLLVANPAFDAKIGAGTEAPGRTRSRDFKGEFSPLPGTAVEALEIARLVTGDKVVLQGPDATTAAVRKARSPRILHLATHGFFLRDEAVTPDDQGRRGEPAGASYENPLVRSGLALAGANRASEAGEGDDGILTALEISGMDLRGTELVVLSACETALGDIEVGEGVFGLRRAFTLAGAANVMMSLWPVQDDVTVGQMKEFYRDLGKMSPADSLREAQLATIRELRAQDGVADPSLWAPFIVAGADSLGGGPAPVRR
jgi:CHAT domain-containing protein/tetratricopeptide (TPR) repeat protein